MTDESLTPNMRVLFWLDYGQWCGQGDLYKTLDRAHGGGSTVSAMEKHGLVEQRRGRRDKYRWPREWRKLDNQGARAERKQTIRALIIAAHHFAAATHIPPPTVY